MNYFVLAFSLLFVSLASVATAQQSEADDTDVAAATSRVVYPEGTVAYVTDVFRVPLRETPCSRCTIVHRGIKSGTKMTFIETVDGWGHVITDKGIEGWMEQQYLVQEPIARIKLSKIEAQSGTLGERNAALEKMLAEAREEIKAIRGQLDSSEGAKDALFGELAEIKNISSDAIALNNQNDQLVKNNHMLQRENDALKANVDDLQKDKRNESFLYGGLTVFLGAILVVLIPKLRGRKRFSEWQ